MIKKLVIAFIIPLVLCYHAITAAKFIDSNDKPIPKQRVLLDRVIAVVQNKAIMMSDLENRMKQIDSSKVASPLDLKKQVLESLIIENVQLQRAQQMGISINDDQLAMALQNIAKGNGLNSVNDLINKVEQQGGKFTEFRETIRKDLIIRNVCMADIQSEMQISDNEIKDFLNSPEGKKITEPDFHLGYIFIPIAPSATDIDKTAAANLAEEAYKKLLQGAAFTDVAREYSKSITLAQDGGDLSWKKASQLPDFFVEQAKNMKNGEISKPVSKANGYHLFKLFASKGIHPEIRQEFQIRHILLKTSVIQTEEQVKDNINKIKQRLDLGEDFVKLAKEFSEDKLSKLANGDSNWIALDETIPADFAKAVQSIDKNVPSNPVKTELGWHIIEVIDQRQEDITQESYKRIAYELLANQRYDREVQAWMQKLRDTASVEIKLDELQ
jgi:peptidyl-prolyl cis-trans isomerase SurA